MQVELVYLKDGGGGQQNLALVMHKVAHIRLPTKQITIAKIKTFAHLSVQVFLITI